MKPPRLSANGALQAHAIDLVARDPAELLRQIDGRVVEVGGGEDAPPGDEEGHVIEAVDPGWISRFLAVITDPSVAFILLMIGIYGLIFEFMSPGAVAPGSGRDDLSAVGPLRPQPAADQLCRPSA